MRKTKQIKKILIFAGIPASMIFGSVLNGCSLIGIVKKSSSANPNIDPTPDPKPVIPDEKMNQLILMI
ncbi:hypothetical protein [[Mycoplasma] imitans]|uniref:hypothetical protein n=1 Tax=[Mycoplasma] imitans TaxID=29560 RepID=UPI00048272ED|nr:hypothetical protein [[Mycoplasma] imitans]